jgi:hypothetical protein
MRERGKEKEKEKEKGKERSRYCHHFRHAQGETSSKAKQTNLSNEKNREASTQQLESSRRDPNFNFI